MILYFTGTGNSSYTAEMIQSITGDEIVSMNDQIKEGRSNVLQSENPFVFVCPTYAWRIPKIIEEYIRKTEFRGAKDVYFVLTCGAETGDAIHYVRKLCKEKGFNLKGFSAVVMPDNYIVMYNTTEDEQARQIIEMAKGKIITVAEAIKTKSKLEEQEKSIINRVKSGIINTMFYSFYVSAKGFFATEQCSGCGRCVKLCPLNNIQLVDGKPKWGNNCTHCMACISRCPKESIEYKKNTKGRNRYCIMKL
jgi:ferredoxin